MTMYKITEQKFGEEGTLYQVSRIEQGSVFLVNVVYETIQAEFESHKEAAEYIKFLGGG